MVEIRKQENLRISEIEKIEIEIDQLPLDAAGIVEPKTLHEGRFSIYFIAALALTDGMVTVDNLTEEKVLDPNLTALRNRVRARAGPLNSGLSSKVRIIMKDGETYERYTPAPKGSTEKPLTNEELKDKFKTTCGLPPDRADAVIHQVMEMENLSSVKDILTLL